MQQSYKYLKLNKNIQKQHNRQNLLPIMQPHQNKTKKPQHILTK